MPLTHHVSDLVLSARSQIEQTSVQKAFRMQEQGEARLIDICDICELKQNGTMTGSYQAPRSMLEFWVDPRSNYHKIVFSTDSKLILFCASGMLSALANQDADGYGHEDCHGYGRWLYRMAHAAAAD